MNALPRLKVAGCEISYQVFGEGLPILFIPPPVVGSSVFYYQAAGLSRQFMVILPELRGHGKSDWSDREYTYPVIVDDVRRLMDHLDLEAAIIAGYSMGGAAMFEFVRTYPNRVLTGVSIGGFSDTTDARLQVELGTAVATARAGALNAMAMGIAMGNAESMKTFRYLYRVGKKTQLAAVLSLFEYARHHYCTDDILKTDVPLEFIFGSRDTRVGRHIQLARSNFPETCIHCIPGASHQLPTKRAERVNEILCRIGERVREGTSVLGSDRRFERDMIVSDDYIRRS